MTNQPQSIVWVHGDCLRPDNPALLHADTAPAVFVFDDELLRDYRISLKRLVFLYESLCELPVTIVRGDVATELCAFANQHHATHIVTTASVAPRFQHIVTAIKKSHHVTVLAEEPFVEIPGHTDIKRFSRYWQVARARLFD
jgi:hypothetical protein